MNFNGAEGTEKLSIAVLVLLIKYIDESIIQFHDVDINWNCCLITDHEKTADNERQVNQHELP